MFKAKTGRRFLALLLAILCMVTTAAPSFAMGFDDLQTVIDMAGGETGGDAPYEFPEDTAPGQTEDTPAPGEDTPSEGTPPVEDTTPAEDAPAAAPDASAPKVPSETPPEEKKTPDIVDSGTPPDDWLIPDGYVLTFGSGALRARSRSASGEQTNIYHETDWSMTHRYPFGSGTSTMPAYIFRTADGRPAYCIEPAKFNSTYGHLVTGQLRYDKLSLAKQSEIAKAISANSSGASDHRMYLACQAIIWEIAMGQSHRSGSVYSSVIIPNNLTSEYEEILSDMENLSGEIPSFMDEDKDNAPYYEMEENGGKWTVELENTNSSITMSASDFSSKGPFTYQVSGDTLTVTSRTAPNADSFVQWSGGDGGTGLIFWVNSQNIQDKASWNAGALPGIGYMKFSNDALPPFEPGEEPEEKVGYLEITKYDGTTNLPLGGAVFRVECEGFINEAFSVPYGGAVIVIPMPEGADSVEVTVTEVTAPDLYEPDPTPQRVTVTAGETVNVAKVSFVNYPMACSLTVYKYDKGGYSHALAGAKFRIRYADPAISGQVWEETTKADGTITIDPLPAAGTLVIEELEAPPGFEIGEVRSQFVTVQKGENKRVDISNDKHAQLIVWKKDAVSGQLLQGAVFKATCISNGISKTAESGPDGRAVFHDLIPNQEYRVEEITPPPYFLPSTKVETVVIPDDSYKSIELTWENQPYSGLTIRKVSATDGRGLKGAVFGLYQGTDVDAKKFLGEFQTDDNGRIVIDKLESNQYYTVVERQPPVNHLLDEDNTRTILIKPDALENNITLIFRNKEKPKILIEKVDEHDAPVPNCTFKVSRRDSAEYRMVTTGPDGTVLVEGLEEDWYQVVEVKAADGTLIDDTIRDVELVAGTTTTLRYLNYRKPTLTIQKIDEATGRGLDNAVIRVWREGVDEHQDYTTQGGGYIRLTDLEPGFILCQEVKSPAGFVLDDTVHRIELKAGENHQLSIKNSAIPVLTLRKIDEQTLKGIEGVTFRFSKDGEHRDVTTGKNGIITESLAPGWWSYQEISCPDAYILNEEVGYVELVAGENKEVVVKNQHRPSLRIIKTDSATQQPLEGVHFTLSYKDGTPLGEYVTDRKGEIYLENITPGYVQIKELPFEGYIALNPEQEILVEWGKVAEAYFENEPENPILIKKIDTDGRPIEGCVLQVLTIDGGFVAELKTGRNGYAVCTGVKPGWYLVKEIYVEGHILDDTPKQVELKIGEPAVVELVNKPLNGIEIYKKTDDDKPLEGVEFTVKKENNLIGTYRTAANGLIQIPDLEPGFYTVFESKGVEGYTPDARPQTVELKWGDCARLEFVNTKYSDFQVIKRDSVTKEPIAGVSFRITKMNGEYIGDYKTGAGGTFSCELEPGWYSCFETATIPGYVLDSTPQNFEVKEDKPVLLEFENVPLSGLQIVKQDQAGKPLAGVQFSVKELDGRDIGTFTSDEAGICYIPDLKEGFYTVTEIRGLASHKADTLPRNVRVETGKLNKVVYTNYEYPVLVVRKVDSETMQPLGGVRFRLMDKYQREIGIYTTHEATGQIILTGMDEGEFYLQEVEARDGYRLDSTVRKISLQWGKTTTVEVKNTPLASLRLKKVSSEDKKPIPSVEFILYDMKNNVVASSLITDQDGIIELPRTIPAGNYKLREIATAPAFVLDEQVRTIQLKAGETTEIVIENEPKRGQIQITKVAGAENPITKDKEGAPLGGAVFEIYDNKMELVDTITTDAANGIATSKPLPLGVYGIKETTSPEYYFTDGKMFYAEIKVHEDLVKFKVKNTPVELKTTVEKRGVEETRAGETFLYTLSNIQNASNVPLTDFYIRDKLPTEAVRLEKVWTGEWSQRAKMDFEIRTNRKGDWRTVKEGLLSTVNNEIDCSRSALDLSAGEYVTEFRLVFREEVQPGFHDLTGPKIEVRVKETVKDGQKFVNKVDVGGLYGGEWVYDTDGWTTVTFNKPKGKLPKTGW